MKVIAYSLKEFEKEFIARANKKKHDITLISNSLNKQTAAFAEGKTAALVFANDEVSAAVIHKLADLGVKYIATRANGLDNIDKQAAQSRGIKLGCVASYPPRAVAEHTVALVLALNRHLVEANNNTHNFDFRLDKLMGFDLYSKTVGIIGLGRIGKAVATIFNGFGCRVLGHDPLAANDLPFVEPVSLQELCSHSDIISLHVPLTEETVHLINKVTLAMMKQGVMLINTSRGGVVKTIDLLDALDSGRLGYLGLDVYEFEQGLFFENHEDDLMKDPLYKKIIAHPNVITTPHSAFLTRETLEQIANETISNLDRWEQDQV